MQPVIARVFHPSGFEVFSYHPGCVIDPEREYGLPSGFPTQPGLQQFGQLGPDWLNGFVSVLREGSPTGDRGRVRCQVEALRRQGS
jgi:hypothetical protein